MAKFVWTENLNIGVDVIDQQHRQIVDYINQLDDARTNRASQKVISKLISDLVDHTIFHFGFEETLQEKVGYPYINAHQKMHAQFAKRVTELQARFNVGADISQDLDNMVVNWLFDHLKHDDQDYVKSVKEYMALHPDFMTEKKGLFARLFK
jgi:hemerythrin